MLLVYIAEAHAADVWPINSSRCAGPANSVYAHTSPAERAAAARRMVRALGVQSLPLLCDGMDDAFLRMYAAWPIRMYGVRAGTLELIAEPHGASFALPPLRQWLLDACADAAGA